MYWKYNSGIVEVIVGPMFSGKSQELIKRIKTMSYANIKTLVFKPTVDVRWDTGEIRSRSGASVKTIVINNAKDILGHWTDEYMAIAIDEAQFFGNEIVKVVTQLAANGVRVMVSGLDMDYKNNPFGPIPALLSVAEKVTKLAAVCAKCHNAATTTYRKEGGESIIQVGDGGEYEARCRSCHKAGDTVNIQ